MAVKGDQTTLNYLHYIHECLTIGADHRGVRVLTLIAKILARDSGAYEKENAGFGKAIGFYLE